MASMRGKRCAVLFTSAALTLLAARTPAAAAEPGTTAGVAVSAGGLVASAGFFADDGRVFAAAFVIPGSPASSSATTAVDFTRPWASLTIETKFVPPFGTDSQFGCDSVANPTTWSPGAPVSDPLWNYSTVAPLSGISFDVSCADGITYRVTWNDTTFGGATPWGTFGQQGEDVISWGAGGDTSASSGNVVVMYPATEVADVTVCVVQAHGGCVPVAGGGFSSGSVYPVSQLVLVEAQQ